MNMHCGTYKTLKGAERYITRQTQAFRGEMDPTYKYHIETVTSQKSPYRAGEEFTTVYKVYYREDVTA